MKIIGHRGARGLAPENTIASLLKALEHNVDEIEFDVRVTKDGVVILLHDPHLTDAAGNRLRVTDYTYKQLLEHKADLPEFEAAMRAINRKVPVYVEVKPRVDLRPIVKIIKKLLKDGWTTSDILLGSKSQATLKALHQELPEIQKIVIERWSIIKARWRARQVDTKRLSMNHHVLWWGLIASAKRGGWELYPYTLNDVDKVKRWQKHGLIGTITDFPDRFEK